jgi:hypothetical protein
MFLICFKTAIDKENNKDARFRINEFLIKICKWDRYFILVYMHFKLTSIFSAKMNHSAKIIGKRIYILSRYRSTAHALYIMV